MKTTAPFFLSFLFSLLASAMRAEEGLIPLKEFAIMVPVTKMPNPKGLEVEVRVMRPGSEPLGGTATEVQCPAIPFFNKSLQPDDRAALLEACAAALSGQEYRKETERKPGRSEYDCKTVYEVVTVEGQKRVRIGRAGVRGGGDAFLDPEVGARLKEALVQAAAAEAWYKMLLTARTLPEKTAAAHPPKATGYMMYCKLDVVHGEGLGDAQAKGLDYRVLLQKAGYTQGPTFHVDHSLQFVTMRGTQG